MLAIGLYMLSQVIRHAKQPCQTFRSNRGIDISSFEMYRYRFFLNFKAQKDKT